MKTKPEQFHLICAWVGIFSGFLGICVGEYSTWPFAFAAAAIRCYQIEAWHFEIEDDDDGDDWKPDEEPVPTAPTDSADWWKKGAS